jgi:hypothetical protein
VIGDEPINLSCCKGLIRIGGNSITSSSLRGDLNLSLTFFIQVHTNEIIVLLGDNWFVERSAKQAR